MQPPRYDGIAGVIRSQEKRIVKGDEADPTLIEEAVDAVVHRLLRQPAQPSIRTMYAHQIASGRMDWEMLERTIRTSHAYRTRQSSPDNRDAITDHIKAASQSAVLSGPFAGMRITDLSSRGDGDLAPKLLGTYEQDLHGVITACATRRYDAIIDIGCAEGYYAVGLALLFPRAPVFAFDIDRDARDILMRNARLNACENQIVVGEGCDPAALAALYRRYPRALVLCDCEGYETQLFGNPQTNALGRRADLLIECHDAWDAAITPALIAALSPTHAIVRIEQGARNPHAAACLAELDEWDRWRAIWERRGPAQHWLFCAPLAPDAMSSSRQADM